VKELMQHTQDC